VHSVRLKWAELEQEQLEFVNGVTSESLNKMFPIRTIQISLASLMFHLVNHSTYHRGPISWMMRQLHAEPVATDFARFLLEGRRWAAVLLNSPYSMFSIARSSPPKISSNQMAELPANDKAKRN
jgi:hypothetical protein